VGRISALIEVGAGFNPELTGRENIYLNGAILGIETKDIDARYDDIVAFSELEKFIETPVKWYSSGMYVRLGFSVAVALDPHVLLVDEVLAVGDAAFRTKSMEKMLSFANDRNVTIVFVSHNMRGISSICDRVVWLDQGRIQADGPTEEVIEKYNDFLAGKGDKEGQRLAGVETADGFDVLGMELRNGAGEPCTEFKFGDPLRIRLNYRAAKVIERPYVTFAIFNKNGHLYTASNLLDEQCPERLEGEGFLEVEFEKLELMPGRFQTAGVIHQKDGFSHVMGSVYMPSFTIVSDPKDYGWNSKFAHVMIGTANCVATPYRWNFSGTGRK
jgi:hypothetical protein